MTTGGWQGFWHTYGGGHSLIVDRDNHEKKISKLLRRSGRGMRELRELMTTLNGSAAGGTASASYTRAAPGTPFAHELGGKRTIETVTVINRATDAADVQYVDDVITEDRTNPLVKDVGGNSAINGRQADR